LFTRELWYKMSVTKQERLCTLFNLKEETECRLSIQNQIVLILNGRLSVEVPGDSTIKKYKIGQVCGAIDLFESALAKPDKFRDNVPIHRYTLIIKERASILCMNFKDYYKTVCVEESANDALVDQYVKMNFAERKIFEVTGILKKSRLSLQLQTFLESNKLLSQVPGDESFKYICEDSAPTKIPVDTNIVYFILEGSLRLLVEMRQKGGLLVCSDGSDENQGSISVKTNILPLVILEAGSVLNVENDFFHYALPSSSAAAVYQADEGSLTVAHDDCSMFQVSLDGSRMTVQSVGHTESSSGVISSDEDNEILVSKHLFIVFEKHTRYLTIPKVALNRALRTEALEEQPRIRNEIDQLGELLKRRVRHIAPWMRGRLDVALVNCTHYRNDV
jgi:hypothetical protein